MMASLVQLEEFFEGIVLFCIIFLEFIGLVVLMSSALRSIYHYCRRDSGVRLMLAKGIALALEFKLGSEVLRTVIVREKNELVILGAIIALRAALTFLIHWEIKNESKEED